LWWESIGAGTQCVEKLILLGYSWSWMRIHSRCKLRRGSWHVNEWWHRYMIILAVRTSLHCWYLWNSATRTILIEWGCLSLQQCLKFPAWYWQGEPACSCWRMRASSLIEGLQRSRPWRGWLLMPERTLQLWGRYRNRVEPVHCFCQVVPAEDWVLLSLRLRGRLCW